MPLSSAARRGMGLRLLEERSELGILLHDLFQARRPRQLEEGLQSPYQLLGGLRSQVGSQPGLQDDFAENLSVLRPNQRNLVAENYGWFGRPGLPGRDDQPREQVAFDRSVIAPPADHGQDVEGEPGEFLWDALLEPLGRLRPEGSDGFIRETMTRSGARCRAAESLDRPGQDRLHRVRFLRRQRRANRLGRPLGIEPGDPLGGGLPGLGVAARQGLEQPPGTIRVFLENLLSERAIDLDALRAVLPEPREEPGRGFGECRRAEPGRRPGGRWIQTPWPGATTSPSFQEPVPASPGGRRSKARSLRLPTRIEDPRRRRSLAQAMSSSSRAEARNAAASSRSPALG